MEKLSFKNIHLNFKLDGIHYNKEGLLEIAQSFTSHKKPFKKAIGCFLLDWLNNSNTVTVNTSGSTGKPKQITIKKQAMVNSAIATGTFFNLKPKDTALHCLPSQFIAGKMMLVRAMVLGLEIDLIPPTLQPVFNTNKHYDFCAMIPLQLENTLQSCNRIKTIIVGGASVSNTLKNKIKAITSNVYETYGMTETVTHIALKQINNVALLDENKVNNFKILPNISISQDNRECLVINAPKLIDEEIITNDTVKIHSKTEFEWLGRYDNVINSGGLKLFPEQIEAKLQSKINQRFFVASKPHETLGNQLILVLEGETNQLNTSIFSVLNKYEKPKLIYTIKDFIETSSGKIQRKKTLEKIKK